MDWFDFNVVKRKRSEIQDLMTVLEAEFANRPTQPRGRPKGGKFSNKNLTISATVQPPATTSQIPVATAQAKLGTTQTPTATTPSPAGPSTGKGVPDTATNEIPETPNEICTAKVKQTPAPVIQRDTSIHTSVPEALGKVSSKYSQTVCQHMHFALMF